MAPGIFGRSGGGSSGGGNAGGSSGGAGDGTMPPAFALTAMIAELRSYWEALRNGPALPDRAAIDPRGIRGALQGAFLVERIAPGMGRLRIAGMNFTDLMGMDARGMPLSALFDPMGRARLGAQLEQVFQRPAVLDLHLECETGIGRPALRGRMILLPLAGNGDRGECALGCLALAGQIGRTPRRLIIQSSRLECLTPESPDLRRPADRVIPAPAASALSRQPAFAEPPAPAFGIKANAKAKPWARLVDLGRG